MKDEGYLKWNKRTYNAYSHGETRLILKLIVMEKNRDKTWQKGTMCSCALSIVVWIMGVPSCVALAISRYVVLQKSDGSQPDLSRQTSHWYANVISNAYRGQRRKCRTGSVDVEEHIRRSSVLIATLRPHPRKWYTNSHTQPKQHETNSCLVHVIC